MIYAPILSSSQHVVKDLDLTNGIVVIARQQTAGMGRDKNQVNKKFEEIVFMPIKEEWIPFSFPFLVNMLLSQKLIRKDKIGRCSLGWFL